MTKGPLAVILASGGLLAYLWERRAGTEPPRLRGSHLAGIACFLLICLGWLLLAWRAHGYALIDKLFMDELFGQATGSRKQSTPGANLVKPTIYLISRFAPFSLVALYAIWRVVRHPSAVASERRFERFLVCWLGVGMVIFSLAAHHRADLLLPLWPAAALLAGREAARWLPMLGECRFAAALLVLVVGLLAFAWWTYHPTSGRRYREAARSEAVRAAATALLRTDLNPEVMRHDETPETLQMYLGTAHPWLTPEQLDNLRLPAGEPVYLATTQARPPAPWQTEVFRWPQATDEELVLVVYRISPGIDP